MKIKSLILSLALIFTLSGCSEKEIVTVNIDSNNGVSQGISTVLGKSAMIWLGNGLWYDSATGIVYWWNGKMNYLRSDTTPTPYYSSNGLLYRYIPETNTLEEVIKID